MKKIWEMTAEERSRHFTKLGRKGGLASKKNGTDYSKLAKLSHAKLDKSTRSRVTK